VTDEARLISIICCAIVFGLSLMCGAWFLVASMKPPRQHIYWCYVTVYQTWQGYRYSSEMSLPCMYRTNDPVSV
jgi:hypothetical protein